jgi:hypothetical protein
VYLPVVGKLMSPMIHFFLWLLSKNKLLTRDNLEKDRILMITPACFAPNRNLFTIYFLIVWLLGEPRN